MYLEEAVDGDCCCLDEVGECCCCCLDDVDVGECCCCCCLAENGSVGRGGRGLLNPDPNRPSFKS